MRILQVEKKVTLGGQALRALGSIELLRRRGHDVTLACPPGSALGERVEALGVGTIRLAMSGAALFASAVKLRGQVRRGAFDVVHAHGARDHLLAALALAGRRRPALIRTKHNIVPFHGGAFSRLLYRRLTDRIIAVSAAVRDVLMANGVPAGHIAVIHDCVDIGRFEPRPKDPRLLEQLGLSAEHVVIGTVGRLASSSMDTRTLLAAVRKLSERYAHVRVLLVGRGVEPMVQAASELGIEELVILPGFCDDVPAMLSVMDLFVQPNKRAGMGNALLEAMAMARPVVATRVGGIPEAVDEGVTGRLCGPGDPQAMADAIASIIDRPDELRQMGRSGRRRAEEMFSLERMVDQLERVYEQVVQGRAGRPPVVD